MSRALSEGCCAVGYVARLTIGIHDIDIARWLFDSAETSTLPNPKKQVNRVFALGQNVRHPELSKDGDADNALAIVEFASGKILHFHCSRTTMHGHDCVAEVFGTEGRAVVNAVSFVGTVCSTPSRLEEAQWSFHVAWFGLTLEPNGV